MRASRLTACAALAMAAIGCSRDNRQGQPYTMPSGHVIRILGEGPLRYTNGNPPSLLFRYQTDLHTSDKAALTKEVDEIWTILQVDADRGGYTSAIVSANEVPEGLIFKKAQGYNFAYDKRDGIWHSLEDEKAGSK